MNKPQIKAYIVVVTM